MGKENWINEVLESTKGMQKAEPSPFLYEQITARISKGEKGSTEVNPFLKWGLTTFVLIILSLNVISIVTSNSGGKESTETANISESYFNNATIYNY